MSDFRTIKPNDPADFTPTLGDYKTLQPFRYWCQKVLPLVYDDSLSYYELLCKVIDYLNKTMSDVETLHGDVTNLHTAYVELQSYVNNYFSTLDVQEEIDNKLNEMASNGSLSELIKPFISTPSLKIVNSTSDMTDNTTFYVLSTNSHIYYYDGNNFIDSGMVYNSVDGAYIKRGTYNTQSEGTIDLNNLIETGWYSCFGLNNSALNAPTDNATNFELYVLSDSKSGYGGIQLYKDYSNNILVMRQHWGATWGEWINIATGKNTYKQIMRKAYNETYNEDANNFTEVGIYSFYGGTNGSVNNVPSGESNNLFELYVLGLSSNGELGLQIYSDGSSTKKLYFRKHFGDSWSEWNLLYGEKNTYKQIMRKSYNETYNEDANSFTEVGIYSFYGGTNGSVNNVPTGESNNLFELYVLGLSSDGELGLQIYSDGISTKKLYFRKHFGSSWSEWNLLYNEENITAINNEAYKGLGNFVAIGDSLTQSLSYKNSSTSKVVASWATLLAERMNKSAKIVAKGGWTVSDYLSLGKTEAESDVSQFAIIYLGTNDVNVNTNIDTFKTQYREAINGLLVNHKFVLCVSLSPVTSGETRDTYNNVIKELCNTISNVFYCDITKLGFLFNGYTNWGHLSSTGYSALATAISLAINDVLKNNYFRYELDF